MRLLNSVRNFAITTVLVLGVYELGHVLPKFSESRKISDVPSTVIELQLLRDRVQSYLSDGFVTPDESFELYRICRHVHDEGLFRDSQRLSTSTGSEISRKLFMMRHDFRDFKRYPVPVEGFDGRHYPVVVTGMRVEDSGETIDLLSRAIDYVGSDEFSEFYGPIELGERARRHLFSFLTS